MPILTTDREFTVGRATKYLTDPRVKHYWDPKGELVRGYAPVLGLEGDAWDIYLLYGREAAWGDAPPKPEFWQEQLGVSEATQFDPPKLAEAIRRALDAK